MATASRLVRRFSASPARSAAASFFPTVPKLKYEGPTTRNPRACPRAPRSFFARAACRPRAAPARLRPAGQRARPFALSTSAGACRRRARARRHRFLPLPLLSSAVPPARSRLCAIQCVRGRHGPHDEGLAALFGVLLAHVPRVSFRAPPRPPRAPFRRARSPSARHAHSVPRLFFCSLGADPFGGQTLFRPWDDNSNSCVARHAARARVRGALNPHRLSSPSSIRPPPPAAWRTR